MRPLVAVISHKRSANVRPVEEIVGEATWFVGEGEGEEYRVRGAKSVVESGGLCRSRNAALDAAFAEGRACVQLSDDLKGLDRALSKTEKSPVTFAEVLSEMEKISRETRSRLVGVAPTSNTFYFDPRKAVSFNKFIVGDLIFVAPCELRFDEQMRLKEDYDYTLQHIKAHGRVARLDSILAQFAHRSNKGGAVSYRTSEMEKEMIAYLRKRWGSIIADNPNRPDEILLRLPKAKVAP